ncbi:hypothetical protein Tco_0303855 [Tanacetum coccineum]
MINMDTMKIKATKVEITRRKENDLPGYKKTITSIKKILQEIRWWIHQRMDQEGIKGPTHQRCAMAAYRHGWPVWNDKKKAATGFAISALVERVVSNSSS